MKGNKSSFNNKEESMNINKFIMSHPELDYSVGAEKCSISVDAYRKRYRKIFPPKKINAQNSSLTPEQQLEKDISLRSAKKREVNSNKKLDILVKSNEELLHKLKVYEAGSEVNHYAIPKTKGYNSQATAVALFSDFHYGEVVTPSAMLGKNEYNCAIAKARADAFFANVVKLCNDFGKHSKIDNLVLGLLGDLITGEIHEALAETNEVMSMEGTLEVTRILKSGIKHILDNTKLEIDIPCVVGNHSRNTKKIHFKNGVQHSYEFIIYSLLKEEFRNEKRVRFYIPLGAFVVLDLNGFKVRFSHGYQIRYIGGTGGVQAPASRVINGWQSYENVNLDCFGHHHSYFATSQFVCNGAVVGSGEYAMENGFRYEPPQQAFFLIDHKKNRRTTTCPVFLE